MRLLIGSLLAAALSGPAAFGQKDATPATAPPPAPVIRQHEITLNGKSLKYTTTTGLMPLKSATGEVEASIFYIAYTLNGVADPAKRRLTFSFNGGPGSASVWLHLGALGPKRIRMNDDGSMPAPPYRMEVNPGTWLDETDLVFIDPVGTGYSRAAKPDLGKKFFGLLGDLDSVGEFIRLYLGKSNRWMSPLFVAGESYGTTRAAGLAGTLANKGIALNGVLLISTILNFQTVQFAPGNDLPYALYLPSYTATAWYHKKLPADLQKDLKSALRESEKYATGPYSQALMKGDALTPAERAAAVKEVARLTGLSPQYVDQSDLRIEIMHFIRELLRGDNQLAGRLDSRLKGDGLRASTETAEYDPSMTAIRPPYTAAFNWYVRSELGYENDAEYYILGGGIGRWDWGSDNRYANVSGLLRQGFVQNPSMKLYLGAGYYDLATPYFAAWYTMDHLGLAPELRKNIRRHEYEAGHMYYIQVESLKAMKRDVDSFLQWAAPTTP
jgi:carboxypeptidase C (cathepsin A)